MSCTVDVIAGISKPRHDAHPGARCALTPDCAGVAEELHNACAHNHGAAHQVPHTLDNPTHLSIVA
eukprot:scaffold57786_cov21-Tisochrysis_lutea.AAC.1